MPRTIAGNEKFIDDIHAKTGGPPVNPNMIYVLYAPNSSDPSDSYFQDYDAQPWSYGNGGTLGFETHERYSNDQLTPMRMYLQKEGRAVGGFSADDMFPEGEPYLNICCTYFNLDLTSPPQPGCLTAGFQKCFDEESPVGLPSKNGRCRVYSLWSDREMRRTTY